MNDRKLLEEYVATGSQTAFAELVERHIALVHSAARRRLGGDSLAEDVAQQVFLLLARKAGKLGGKVVLSGWLYRTACQVASETLRGERRRREREQRAVDLMKPLEGEPLWRRIKPGLDAAMARLSPADQDAVVLRYFENRSLREVGAVLGISDDAAQKRVHRALEKLRRILARRGESAPAELLAAAVVSGAIQPAPAGMAAGVSSAVLAGAVGSIVTTTNLMSLMSLTSLKNLVGITAAIGAATVIGVQSSKLGHLRETETELNRQAVAAKQEAARLNRTLEEMRKAVEEDPRKMELLKLRAETAKLRRQQTEWEAENAQLRQAAQQFAAAERERQAAGAEMEAQREAIEQQKQMGLAKLNYVKRWTLTMHMYADDHNDRLPDTLSAASAYFGSGDLSADKNAVYRAAYGQLRPSDFEIVYHGPLQGAANPPTTILLREKTAWPNWNGEGASRTYGFVDGHSEIHYAPDGDFSAWEAERLVPDR